MALPNASSAVIEPQAASATGRFTLSKDELPARLTATNLAGSENVTLKAIDGPSEVLTACYKDGVAVTCKAADPVIVIDAPGPYEVTKSATASASAGVYLAKGG